VLYRVKNAHPYVNVKLFQQKEKVATASHKPTDIKYRRIQWWINVARSKN